MLEDKNILVTGGLGFIGSNLVRRLVDLGARITIVDSMIPDYGGNLFNISGIEDKVSVNIADVRDEYSMNYLVRDKDYIFNLAGQVSHIDSMLDPYTDLEINCKSQLSTLEACRKNNKDVKIIYTSTRQIYGKPKYLPVDEKHSPNPMDVNGINKLAGEMYHILYNNVYGVRAVSLRLTNTYGPRQLIKHNRHGFVGWFIKKVVCGEEIEIFGDGTQKRDFNYVDDVIDALILVAENENCWGKIYNLGGDEVVSLKKFTEMLIEINGSGNYRIVPFPPEKKKIDIGDYFTDYSKIKDELGWKPKIKLEEGLKRTIDFYKKYKDYYLN